MSQGSHTRKSGGNAGGRSFYDAALTSDNNAPSGIPIPQRGTTTDRSRGLAKNQYYNNVLQQNSNNIPVSTTQKKKGANSSYVHGGGGGGPPPRGNMSSYVGSMSGSLQDNVKVDPLSFQKSPMLNTGKKMSNTSL